MNKSDTYQRWDNYPDNPVLTKRAGKKEWEFEIRPGYAPFKRRCRAAIYHRASGPNDPLRTTQLFACRQYCERNGLPVYQEFQDIAPEPFDVNAVWEKQGFEAVEALIRKKHQRPAYDKAVVAIKEGRADILVVYSPDHVFQRSEKRTLAYQLCYIPPVAFVEPWQDVEGEEEEEQQPSGGGQGSPLT